MRLITEKKIPKPHSLLAVQNKEIPFVVPPGWEWTRLGKLCYKISDGPHYSPQYVSRSNGVPFLSTRNVKAERFDLSDVKYVSRDDHEIFCQRVRPEKGDILYTKGGTTGIARVNDLEFEFSVWVHLAVLKVAKDIINPHYVALALNSPLCYQQSQVYTQGISNFDLGLTRMIKILLPLPPAHEQHRIVARVDELMVLCDRLEAQLTSAQSNTSRLLEAVLHHALNSGDLITSQRLEDSRCGLGVQSQ
jgi:type I restriction enzyme, S subunit